MVADLVRYVGGDHVAVEQLMGEGIDPHLYKASTGDIARLDAADVIFYSGLHLEGKMADIFARMAKRRATVAVTDGIPRDRLLETAPNHYDPHAWFDVALWSRCLGAVIDGLVKVDPANASAYRENAQKYRDELAKLDAWCRQRLSNVPESRRVLVTAHDAFSYFARAYGFEVRAIQGISTESEAGVREINQLVAFIAEREIKAVFVESSVSERNIRALVEGCEARGHHVRVGGELFSDAMGRPGTPEGTYVGMVRHNVETIAKALE
jgi:manganese/zinc/iron transport system substrate-binding protein